MSREIDAGAPFGNEAVLRKVFWRLVPYLFVLYAVSFLDRINIGFAALSMNKGLGLTATTFGLMSAAFYVGYVACEIPSNLLLVRYGARRWLSRIMITWGLASCATMFVVGTTSLIGVRILVGIFEAGFVPGVLLYLTYWIPDSHRARANGFLMMSQPVAAAIGATLSGLILDRADGLLGLQGWRWMFFIEGAPAILLGFVTLFYLPDRPSQARWLSDGERRTLAGMLPREESKPSSKGAQRSVWSEMRRPHVLLLALAYFALVNTLNATSTWGPTIIRGLLHAYSLTQVGLVSALPPICTIVAIPIVVWTSDRTRDRIWHLSAVLMLAAAGWLLVIYMPTPVGQMAGLCLATSGAFCAMAVFWTLPQKLLATETRAIGIALINAAGLFGSAMSGPVIGALHDLTGSFAAGLFYVTALLFASMLLAWKVVSLASDQPSPHLDRRDEDTNDPDRAFV